ncbi:hypothetical protein ACWGJP_07160 [Microbacterium sp. NPDC055903]
MRRMLAAVGVVITTTGLLVGCTPGPNDDAIAAAEEYADELTAWAAELGTATASAKTATHDEWDALGEGESLPYEEVGIGDILDRVPELEAFDPAEVQATPAYLVAADAASRVGAITTELSALEPEALQDLRLAGYESYWPLADLYYNTLGGPAAERRGADADAADAATGDDGYAGLYEVKHAASIAYLEGRAPLVETAIEAMQADSEITGDPLIPEEGLGASAGAFIIDWLEEESDFLDLATEHTTAWTYGFAFDGLWGHEFLNEVFYTPVDHAAALRPAFARQTADIAAALSDAIAGEGADPSFPDPGDPYRQLLLEGYLPWGDAAEGEVHTESRLWMLWRIRELEDTPDAAYSTARAALLEELNRAREDGAVLDFRPGASRLLTVITEYTQTFEAGFSDVENEVTIIRLGELLDFAEALRELPMLEVVAADFDALIEVMSEANDEFATVVEAHEDPFDAYDALDDLAAEYAERIYGAAETSLSVLDDDAATEQLIADAITATAPAATDPAEPTP